MSLTARLCALTLLLLGTWSVRARLATPHAVAYDGGLPRVPADVGLWKGRDLAIDPELLAQVRVDDYLNRVYQADGRQLGFYVAYYASQKEGDAVHSPLNCLPGSGWQPLTTERLAIQPAGDAPQTINKVVIMKGIDQQLVLYWYQTANRVVASEYLSKAFLVKDAFGSGRTDIALVRIIVPIDPRQPGGEANALADARPFAEHMLPELQKRLFSS
jgi:EpsI family protein